MAANGISTLALKRDRQEAKLALAAINRAASQRRSREGWRYSGDR